VRDKFSPINPRGNSKPSRLSADELASKTQQSHGLRV
jgi:hypothetical protein